MTRSRSDLLITASELCRAFFAFLGVTLAVTQGMTSAQATVVTANGTCLLGTCSTAALGAIANIPFTPFGGVIAVNGDSFQISGSVSATNVQTSSFKSVELNPAFEIKYIGSKPISTTDVINLVFSQQFVSLAKVSLGTFSYQVEGNFGGDAGAGTSLATDNRVNGKSVGVLTFTPPGALFNFAQKLDLNAPLVNPLTDTFDYTLTVAAGTLPGFFVEVAEPASTYLLLGAGLLALGLARRRVR